MEDDNLDSLKIDISELSENISSAQINTSWFKDIQQQQVAFLNSIKPREQLLAENLEPIVSNNNLVIERLTDNYNELLKLNEIKQYELEEAQKEAKKAKRMNIAMLIIFYYFYACCHCSLENSNVKSNLTDSIKTKFEQIFKIYSSNKVRKVL